MQRIASGSYRNIDDVVRVKVTRNRFGADVVGLVRFFYVQRMAIGIRVDGNRLDAHFRARAHNANRNFPTVGDKYFLNHEIDPVPVLKPVNCNTRY